MKRSEFIEKMDEVFNKFNDDSGDNDHCCTVLKEYFGYAFHEYYGHPIVNIYSKYFNPDGRDDDHPFFWKLAIKEKPRRPLQLPSSI